MWYWNKDNIFTSEVMFCNPMPSDSPKLIITLDIFEKMKKVYNNRFKGTGNFKALMDTFRLMRKMYYAEIQQLKNLLKAAKEAQEERQNGGYAVRDGSYLIVI
jgi:hypothetical protein